MSLARRAKDLFDHALERPTEERGAYLDRECAGDAALRAQVETLLVAHREAGAFLAAPTVDHAAGGEERGAVIDRYKLLEKIGEGGFGEVWRAQQTEPVRRRVALKVIKRGMDTKQVVARFEAERQALALMDHPNIATVLDGGATPRGRPYFVMELVSGLPITEFCDAEGLELRARVQLLRTVCLAVQHAHQKGVIHRDLKPSNILVGADGGEPTPVVIDFGVAKATSQELTQQTVFTELRQLIGTPEYMAPEQARSGGLDIDTRVDVYSLGVVLYELLTGTKPFSVEPSAAAGYVEMLRQISEEEPPRPSTRISTLGEDLQAVARRRRTDPAQLGRVMRGDLDWIVMCAIDKDRSRRYPTASALAADLQRYLDGQAVEAGPPGAGYRLRKFAARHRQALAVAALVLVALLAGVVGIAWALQRALVAEAAERDLRRRAEDSAATARAEAERTAAVLRLTEQMLGASDPHERHGPDFTVRQLLDDFERRLGKQIEAEPAVEAVLRSTIGWAYLNLGMTNAAEPHLRRSMQLWTAGEAADPERRALSEARWAWLLHDRGDFVGAERQLRDALRGLADVDPAVLGEQQVVLADLLRHQGRLAEAQACVEEALALLVERVPDHHTEIGKAWYMAGRVAAAASRFDDAQAAFRRALASFETRGFDDTTVASTLTELSAVLAYVGETGDVESLRRRAWEIAQRTYGDDHPATAVHRNALAHAIGLTGDVERADAMHAEAAAVARAHRAARPRSLGIVLFDWADTIWMRHAERAEELLREALAIQTELGGSDAPAAVEVRSLLGRVLVHRGEAAEAETMLRAVQERQRALYGAHHSDLVYSHFRLGLALLAQGDADGAGAEFESSAAVARAVFGEQHSAVAEALEGLGQVRRRQRDFKAAAAAQAEACGIKVALFGEEHVDVAGALGRWAGSLMSARDFAGAETVFRRSLAAWEAVRPEAEDRWQTSGMLGRSLLSQQKYAEAAPRLRAAVENLTSKRARGSRKAVARWLLELHGRAPELVSEAEAAGYRAIVDGD